ncbi:hypothetical protein A3844_28920 [Paenibacillus helianthi]|uniref:DUF3139 domain-containing protein n=1 Tax=Paenibacillus helianthi TaxID=1349432 RepID=A0ABX3EET4_9BACL|nr:DUF3139 domain-containing protein [Paenibacillus helianthi]OKP78738.1 hypothetical protein A3844_28920 [Paenibacillus helianthi]
MFIIKKVVLSSIAALVSLIIIFLVGYVSINGVPYKKTQAAKQIKAYLITKKNYTEDEIYSIKGSVSKSSICRYGAEVTFNDEIGYPYEYGVCNDGEIHQQGYTSTTPKHLDDN